MAIAEVVDVSVNLDLDFPVVVADTSKMSREEWLEARRQGLGGSDAAWVMGMSRYKSVYSGWAEKAGFIPEPDLNDVEAVTWGNRLEPVVANAFAERFGFEILDAPVMLAHPEHPWMLANVDRFIVEDGVVVGVLEVKTAGFRMADYWEGDDVPGHYWVQVQHYLACTGLGFAFLTVLIGGQEQRDYRIERNEGFIADLIAQESEMWAHIEAKIAPPIDGSESTIDALRSRWTPEPDSIAELPSEAIDTIVALAAVKERGKEIDAEEKALQAQLMEMMADKEIGQVGGETVVTWKRSNRTTFDAKAFKEKDPDTYNLFTKTSATRTLLPKWKAVA